MIKSYTALDAVPAHRFLVLTSDGVQPASSSADNIAGVSSELYGEEGDIIDVYLPGETVYVTAGAAFDAGAVLTSDDEGRAIEASTSDNIGALALESAEAEGDAVLAVVTIQRNAETAEEETTDEDTTEDTTEE